MNQYRATIHWQRSDAEFTDNKYSRKHEWRFDGGLHLPASASPHVVPKEYTDPSAVDPEEAFVASLSSCHMLWFLSIASQKEYIVDDYSDRAEGKMKKNEKDQLAITVVTLNPTVTFASKSQPTHKIYNQLHQAAHQQCFIAHSVKTEIIINAKLKVTS